MSESIKVVVRVRPINSKQISLNCQTIVIADEGNNQITIVKPDEPDHAKTFAYDSVFSDNSLQSNVYAKTAYQLVENVLQGYNGTIFAYGQTGCGKTHSMVGKLDVQQLQGIIPRSFGHILNTISETKNREFLIRCSFIEIYNQQVRDLLGKDVKKSLQIKESPDKGVFIKDLSSNPAKTHEQLMDYMNLGNKNRSVGQTAMNKDSSRSHLLFMLYLQSADLSVAEQSRKYIGSKLNLVDLAGSQRINKTGAQGQRLQEAKSINLSLSALGNVISALVDGKSHHIPYRDSKLTRLLQDSLGGNTKTVMIANCSPADYNFDETISTLRYASRAKFIKNKPIINEDPKDALLKQYASQIKKLKQILNKQGGNSEIVGGNGIGQQIDEKIKQKQKQLASEKEQKRMLQERLKALEKQHLYSQNVKVDKKIKQNIKEVRQSVLLIPVNSNQLSPSDTKNIKFNSAQLRQTPTQSNGGQQNYKQIVKMLKNQIKDLQGEIEDVQHQNYLDKQLILGDIRELSKQNKLLEGIINILLSPKQLQKVKDKIEKVDRQQKSVNNSTLNNDRTVYGYNEDKNVYNIPNFVLKEKDIILPKLANQNNQDWTLGMELRNNSSINSKGNGSYVSVGPDCSEKKKSGHHQSYQIQDSQDKNSNNDQEKDRLKINIRVGNVPALIIQSTSEIKNSSFMFGKGKQNSKKDNDRKELGSVRGVIQQARQVRESLLACSTITPVKKHLPSQLQPLSKADMHEKLERMMQNDKQKENRAIERPRKLQKLNNYPGSGKAALVQYTE